MGNATQVLTSDHDLLALAWELSVDTAADHRFSVLNFLDDGHGGIDRRALLMFELAYEIRAMRGTFITLLQAWPRKRADTAPCTPRAIRAA